MHATTSASIKRMQYAYEKEKKKHWGNGIEQK